MGPPNRRNPIGYYKFALTVDGSSDISPGVTDRPRTLIPLPIEPGSIVESWAVVLYGVQVIDYSEEGQLCCPRHVPLRPSRRHRIAQDPSADLEDGVRLPQVAARLEAADHNQQVRCRELGDRIRDDVGEASASKLFLAHCRWDYFWGFR